MLFEICNVLWDCVFARLSLEYSIDVTLKNPVFKWNMNQNNAYTSIHSSYKKWVLSLTLIHHKDLLWIHFLPSTKFSSSPQQQCSIEVQDPLLYYELQITWSLSTLFIVYIFWACIKIDNIFLYRVYPLVEKTRC